MASTLESAAHPLLRQTPTKPKPVQTENMSRKSTASLSVVQIGSLSRIAPPDDLTPEQAKLWVAVVESKPAEWFGEDSTPLLAEYVRAASMCSLLEIQIQAAIAGGDNAEIKTLLDMRDKESKRLVSSGTKMRLTQQSRYQPDKASTLDRKVASGAKPWQRKSA